MVLFTELPRGILLGNRVAEVAILEIVLMGEEKEPQRWKIRRTYRWSSSVLPGACNRCRPCRTPPEG